MLETRPNLKRALVVGAVTVTVCLTILGSILLIAKRPIYVQYNTGADGKPVNNISVEAVGKVTVKPDLVTFTATYETKANDLAAVQDNLTKKSASMVKALKDMGVDEKDIQTSSYNLYPNYYYEYNTSKQVQDGHAGSVSVNVKVRDIEKAGEIVDAVVNGGATQISSLNFTIDDLTKARSDARKLAAEAAYEKAKELANSSKVEIGSLISITETTNDYISTPYYANVKMDMAESGSSAPELSAGTLEVSIQVSATYGIQ